MRFARPGAPCASGPVNRSDERQQITIAALSTLDRRGKAVATSLDLPACASTVTSEDPCHGILELRFLPDGEVPLPPVGSVATVQIVGRSETPRGERPVRWRGQVSVDRFLGLITRPGAAG